MKSLLRIETRTKSVEVKAEPEKDKFGQMGVLVWLTRSNVDIIHEALLNSIQLKDPEESNIKKMNALEPEFLKLHDKLNPS